MHAHIIIGHNLIIAFELIDYCLLFVLSIFFSAFAVFSSFFHVFLQYVLVLFVVLLVLTHAACLLHPLSSPLFRPYSSFPLSLSLPPSLSLSLPYFLLILSMEKRKHTHTTNPYRLCPAKKMPSILLSSGRPLFPLPLFPLSAQTSNNNNEANKHARVSCICVWVWLFAQPPIPHHCNAQGFTFINLVVPVRSYALCI